MHVLLSIKPEHSKKIFSGEKKYEFRKRKPRLSIDRVFIYESSPTRSVVGTFSVKRIHSGSPDRIWRKCQESSGLEKRTFQEYCNGTKIIHAFEIDEVFRFSVPINLSEVNPDFKPPQDFSYLKHSAIFQMLKSNQNLVIESKSV